MWCTPTHLHTGKAARAGKKPSKAPVRFTGVLGAACGKGISGNVGGPTGQDGYKKRKLFEVNPERAVAKAVFDRHWTR